MRSRLAVVAAILALTGCSVATYPGREVRTTARVGPPSSVEVQVDGTLRCRARGEMPLELRVFDCRKVRHVDGGMCQPPGAP